MVQFRKKRAIGLSVANTMRYEIFTFVVTALLILIIILIIMAASTKIRLRVKMFFSRIFVMNLVGDQQTTSSTWRSNVWQASSKNPDFFKIMTFTVSRGAIITSVDQFGAALTIGVKGGFGRIDCT